MAFLAILATVVVVLTAVTNAKAIDSVRRDPTFSTEACTEAASRLYLPDAPHDNYFYSDCHSSSHVIITNPRPESNLSIVKPRLLVAWPAGNSGLVAFFAPESGQYGTLSIGLEKTASGEDLDPINESTRVGVSGVVKFNDTARLTVPVLGSIRSIRDFTEGGKLNQDFQINLGFSLSEDGGATINRTWFDNVTTTWLTFTPLNGAQAVSYTYLDSVR